MRNTFNVQMTQLSHQSHRKIVNTTKTKTKTHLNILEPANKTQAGYTHHSRGLINSPQTPTQDSQ